MKSHDNRPNAENDASDLAEDPVLAALNRDLEAVLRRTDNRLFLFLGAALVASYLPDYWKVPPLAASLIYAGAVACIFGGIGFTILSVVRRKQKVAARYGLVCPACGHRPGIRQILATAEMGLCAACHRELDVRLP